MIPRQLSAGIRARSTTEKCLSSVDSMFAFKFQLTICLIHMTNNITKVQEFHEYQTPNNVFKESYEHHRKRGRDTINDWPAVDSGNEAVEGELTLC